MHLNFLRPPEWMDSAACAGAIDDETWFSTSGMTPNAKAKQMCGGCPVRVQCLAYAIETDQEGVWAGTSWQQRKKLAQDGAA